MSLSSISSPRGSAFDQFKVAAFPYSFLSLLRGLLFRGTSKDFECFEFFSFDPDQPALKFNPLVLNRGNEAVVIESAWVFLNGIFLWTSQPIFCNQQKKTRRQTWFVSKREANIRLLKIWLSRLHAESQQENKTRFFWEFHALR